MNTLLFINIQRLCTQFRRQFYEAELLYTVRSDVHLLKLSTDHSKRQIIRSYIGNTQSPAPLTINMQVSKQSICHPILDACPPI